MEERKIIVANPTPVGLLGLAIVTLVASSQKFGWTDGTSLVIPWAIFLGASAQFYASILDAKHNNTFGTTAFGGYGFFWFAVAMSWMVQHGVFGESMQASADGSQLGFAFLGYLIFTLYMTIGSLTTNKNLTLIFVAIDFLFLGLTLSTFGIIPETMHLIAAISEFIISMLSFYGAAATIINTQFGYEVLPLGKAFVTPRS